MADLPMTYEQAEKFNEHLSFEMCALRKRILVEPWKLLDPNKGDINELNALYERLRVMSDSMRNVSKLLEAMSNRYA